MFNIIKHRSRNNGTIIHNHLEMYKNIDRNSINSVYVFTNARDEPNIAEWVAHHLLLGFDKIIIFDHLSVIPISTTIGNNFLSFCESLQSINLSSRVKFMAIL